MNKYLSSVRRTINWFTSHRYAIVCLALAILGAILQPMLVGQIYSEAKAIDLVDSVKVSSLYYGSAMATACATILALMLTLLGLADQSSKDFGRDIYTNIEMISWMATFGFIASIILLLILSLPVGEFKKLPEGWFITLYYTLTSLNFLLAGVVGAIVLSLSSTVVLLIRALAPETEDVE